MNLSEKIIKYIKYLIYILVIAVPLVYFPTIMMPFQLSKTVVFQILTEIIFALWLSLAILNKEYRPKFTPITLALIFFMVVIFLSAIFGSDWRISLWSDESRSLGAIALAHFFALFIIASSLKEKIDWRKLWFLSFGTAVIVSLIGISQKFFAFPRGSNEWLYIIYSGIPERVGSTFSNPAFMAGYLLFNFFIGAWLLVKSEKLKVKSLIGLGAILIFAAIFLSQTLGVMVGLFAGVLFLLIYFVVKKPNLDYGFNLRKLSIILLISTVLLAGLFSATKNFSFWQKVPGFKRIVNFSFQDDSIRGRLITWRLSWNVFKEKPIFGWGVENFRIPFNKYYDPQLLTKNIDGSYWDKPHNIVLEYLTTTGILGLLAYLGIFIAVFYSIFKNLSGFGKPIFAAALISYFIQNLFIFDTIGTYLMFFSILAFINNEGDLSIQRQSIMLANNYLKPIAIILLVLFLVPIYYNYQIFKGANYEYWGVNYFLNQLNESSLISFSRALATPTPYIDDIRKNFANTVKQAYQQGISYPDLNDLQNKLVGHLKLVINRHPQEFLNYIILSEFENFFYQYNANYLEESEELALKALELSPKRQQILYVLGKVRLLKGDIPGAYKVFEKAVNASPDSADPHFYFGLMAYGLGDVKKGSAEIIEAERLGRIPQKVEELIALGNFVGDLENNYKKAIEYYNFALKIIKGGVVSKTIVRENVLLKLAIAYYFDHNYDKSRQTFLELKKTINLKLLPIYPDLEPVLQELGIEK